MNLEERFEKFQLEIIDRLARVETKVDNLLQRNGNGKKYSTYLVETIKLLATALAAVTAAKMF